MALLAAVLLVSGCASGPASTDWKAQKAYGAKMAERRFWREALFRFQKAAELRPDDAELQNNLAVAFESLGDTSRALTAYKRALELSPNDSHIKRNYARFAEYYTSVQRPAAPAQGPTP